MTAGVRRGLALALLTAAHGCVAGAATPHPPPSVLEAADPDPARVEALLLLVGDAGAARPGSSPVLAAAARDVETWAPRLAPEAVTAVFLGDLVYPEGVHAPGHPAHARDTLALHAQLQVVRGPAARAAGTRGWFLAGNHDGGDEKGAPGLARLQGLAARIDAWRAAGLPVRLLPEAGAPGPASVSLGRRHFVIALDSHLWLQAGPERTDALASEWADALAGARGRSVTVLAHHPLQSDAQHGERPPGDLLWGLQAAFSRAGALVQDATSARYRRWIEAVVRAGADAPRPVVWASGHDHTLQLLQGRGPGWPRWTVVAGSASKLGIQGAGPDLVAGGAWPGYARLFLLDDGGAVLQLVAGDPGSLSCREADALPPCMAAAATTFRTILSRRLDP